MIKATTVIKTTLESTKTYIIINFRTCKISRAAHKLVFEYPC